MIISDNLIRKLTFAVLLSSTINFFPINAMECKSANTTPSISTLLLINEAFQKSSGIIHPASFPKELPQIIFFKLLEIYSEDLFHEVLHYLQDRIGQSAEKIPSFKAFHLSDLFDDKDKVSFPAQADSEIFAMLAHFYCRLDLKFWLEHERLSAHIKSSYACLPSIFYIFIEDKYGENNAVKFIGEMMCFAAKHGHSEIANIGLDFFSPSKGIDNRVPTKFLVDQVTNALPLAIESGWNGQKIVEQIFNFAEKFEYRFRLKFIAELHHEKETTPLHKAIECARQHKTFRNIKVILRFVANCGECGGLAWMVINDCNNKKKTALDVVIDYEKKCENDSEKKNWMEIIKLMQSYKPKKSRSNCLIQ